MYISHPTSFYKKRNDDDDDDNEERGGRGGGEMIYFYTGSPGCRKTAFVVDKLDTTEYNNTKNIPFNHLYYQQNKELFKGYEEEFLYYVEETGTGSSLKKVAKVVDSDFFDIFEQEFYSLRPDDYFFKSVIYNDICERIVEQFALDIDYKPLKPVRTIYSNIKALKIDFVRDLALLLNYNGEYDWRLAPDGSIIVIDEIQNIKPYSEVKLKDYPLIKQLSEHRHRGFDFEIITQDCDYLNVDMRGLLETHFHFTKPFGLQTYIYCHSNFCRQPDSRSNKKFCESKKVFSPKKRIFTLYKSTSINTAKKRIPYKVVGFATLGVVFGLSLFLKGITSNRESAVLANSEDMKKIQESRNQNETQKPIASVDVSSIVNPQNTQPQHIQQVSTTFDTPIHQQQIPQKSNVFDPVTQDYFKDVNLAPVSVIAFKNKCSLYNQHSQPLLNYSYDECMRYANDSSLLANIPGI